MAVQLQSINGIKGFQGSVNSLVIHAASEICALFREQKYFGGIGTSRTQSENHTPRPIPHTHILPL
jgi:hypothetical protein